MFIAPWMLAQTGSQSAASIIEQTFELGDSIQESWDFIWASIIDTSSTLWVAVVNFAINIAIFALLYMFIRYGNEISKIRYFGTFVEIFIWPFTVVIFLGTYGIGKAYLLAQSIALMRGIADDLIQRVLALNLAGIRLKDAIAQVQINHLATQRLYQLVSECKDLTGEALQTCIGSKQPEMVGILDGLAAFISNNVSLAPSEAVLNTILNIAAPGQLQLLDLSVDFFQGGFTQVVQDRLYPVIQSFLYILQWVYLNAIEMALVLTALLAPIALALSLLPVAGRPIWAWLVGFISLYTLKLGYALVVGTIAAVIVGIEGDQADIALGYGFITFSAIFAPLIATVLTGWGGVSLYQAISRRSASITSAVSSGLSTLATSGLRVLAR